MARKPSPPTPLPVRRERGESSRDVGTTGADLDASTPVAQRSGRGAGGEGLRGRRDEDGGSRLTSTAIDIQAYAARIGYQGELAPTVETLRALHLAQLRAVPFENLDIHLGRSIVLDEELLFDKIVRRRRGGFCYELNGLFAALLREIGFEVTLLAAQYPRKDGTLGPEFDHLTLLVRGDDIQEPVLADVGAGGGDFAVPLHPNRDEEQPQPGTGGVFRVLPEADAFWVWRRVPDGAWEREYRFTWQPRDFSEFEEGCRFHQTSPESEFTRNRLCTLMTPDGRVTLSDRRLIRTTNGSRSERELDETEYQQMLQQIFGIDLDA